MGTERSLPDRDRGRSCRSIAHDTRHGSITSIPHPSKSRTFRIAHRSSGGSRMGPRTGSPSSTPPRAAKTRMYGPAKVFRRSHLSDRLAQDFPHLFLQRAAMFGRANAQAALQGVVEIPDGDAGHRSDLQDAMIAWHALIASQASAARCSRSIAGPPRYRSRCPRARNRRPDSRSCRQPTGQRGSTNSSANCTAATEDEGLDEASCSAWQFSGHVHTLFTALEQRGSASTPLPPLPSMEGPGNAPHWPGRFILGYFKLIYWYSL